MIRPQVNHFDTRGQNILGSSTIFQTLRFSETTSQLFALQQHIWHHRVFLVETNRVISNFALKKIKIWPSAQFGVTGQIRSKLAGYHSIRSHKTNFLVPISFVYHLWLKGYGQKNNFPLGLYVMGRVENWPDLRPLKWKIRNTNSVGIHPITSSSKFENIRTRTVPTARSSSLRPVPECTSDIDLTWWPDLLTWEVKICTQCVFLICAQLLQIWRRCVPPFLRYLRKTCGRGIICPLQCSC